VQGSTQQTQQHVDPKTCMLTLKGGRDKDNNNQEPNFVGKIFTTMKGSVTKLEGFALGNIRHTDGSTNDPRCIINANVGMCMNDLVETISNVFYHLLIGSHGRQLFYYDIYTNPDRDQHNTGTIYGNVHFANICPPESLGSQLCQFSKILASVRSTNVPGGTKGTIMDPWDDIVLGVWKGQTSNYYYEDPDGGHRKKRWLTLVGRNRERRDFVNPPRNPPTHGNCYKSSP